MKGKREFTKQEINEIEYLIDMKCRSSQSEQKIIRAKIRRLGFYWSELAMFADGYSYDIEGFRKLIRDGHIKIVRLYSEREQAAGQPDIGESKEQPSPFQQGRRNDKSDLSSKENRMGFRDVNDLKVAGFTGFVPVAELRDGALKMIPDTSGIYAVLRVSEGVPVFLETGSGGHFKGNDPNVPVEELVANWVDGTPVVYIGKATSLRKRISQYVRFGQGKPVGHWGGRYIWQLADASKLLFCWRIVNGDPDVVETGMICDFRENYGCRPFANLSK